MRKVLVVDDERVFQPARDEDEAIVLYKKTADEAVLWLERQAEPLDELWLDHDLGENSVMPFITALEEAVFNGNHPAIGTVYVHTQNPDAAATIMRSRLLNDAYRLVRAEPTAHNLYDQWDKWESEQ